MPSETGRVHEPIRPSRGAAILADQCRGVLGAVARSRSAFLTAALFFTAGILASLIIPAASSTPTSLDHRPPQFFILHNLRAIAFLWLGVATFGLATIGGSLLNGLTVGNVLFADAVAVPLRVALLAPHGIVEFPALWLGAAAGFRVPLRVVAYLRGAESTPLDTQVTRDTLRLAVTSAVLIAVAGVLEAYLTPFVATQI